MDYWTTGPLGHWRFLFCSFFLFKRKKESKIFFMSELILYQKSYDFLVWVFNKTDGFPKSKRFSIGQRLETVLLDYITLVYKFKYSRKTYKSGLAISAKFDEVKLLIKICYDTKLISKNSFAYAMNSSDEIGAMIGGIIKAFK